MCFNRQVPAFSGFNALLCVCSSRKNVSILTCHIALKLTTTRAPPSVTTVEVYCGVCTSRALNVKVSLVCWVSLFVLLLFFLFSFLLIYFLSESFPLLGPFHCWLHWPDCGMNVHSGCTSKVGNLCGINQKLLAEALSQVSQVCTVIGWTLY